MSRVRVKTELTVLNGYQVRAAEAVTGLLKSLPQSHKVVFECRGIVGGDFDVIAEWTDKDSRRTRDQQVAVKVLGA